jgi:hypothetical protein
MWYGAVAAQIAVPGVVPVDVALGHAPRSTPDGGLEFIVKQIARLPPRRELAKYAFVLLFVGAVIGIVGIEAFWRYVPRCSADPTSPRPAAAMLLL